MPVPLYLVEGISQLNGGTTQETIDTIVIPFGIAPAGTRVVYPYTKYGYPNDTFTYGNVGGGDVGILIDTKVPGRVMVNFGDTPLGGYFTPAVIADTVDPINGKPFHVRSITSGSRNITIYGPSDIDPITGTSGPPTRTEYIGAVITADVPGIPPGTVIDQVISDHTYRMSVQATAGSAGPGTFTFTFNGGIRHGGTLNGCVAISEDSDPSDGMLMEHIYETVATVADRWGNTPGTLNVAHAAYPKKVNKGSAFINGHETSRGPTGGIGVPCDTATDGMRIYCHMASYTAFAPDEYYRTDTGCSTTLGSQTVLNPDAIAKDANTTLLTGNGIVTPLYSPKGLHGPGIPDDTNIDSVNVGVSWHITKPATATASPVSLIVGRPNTSQHGDPTWLNYTNFGTLTYSDDMGDTWTIQDGLDGSDPPLWPNRVNGDWLAHFQTAHFVRNAQDEDDGYLYMLGSTMMNSGNLNLGRCYHPEVGTGDPMDPGNWEYFEGADVWGSDPDDATDLIPPVDGVFPIMGTSSTRWSEYLGCWVNVFLDAWSTKTYPTGTTRAPPSQAGLTAQWPQFPLSYSVAPELTGPWTPPELAGGTTGVADSKGDLGPHGTGAPLQAVYPVAPSWAYMPQIHPFSPACLGTGPDLYVTASNWVQETDYRAFQTPYAVFMTRFRFGVTQDHRNASVKQSVT